MQSLKFCLGKLCARIFPERRRLVLDNFTLPFWGCGLRMDVIDRLIRFYYARRFSHEADPGLEDLHRNFWRKQEKSGWFLSTGDRLEQLYIPQYGQAAAQAAERALEMGITRLVEFGTGNGDWLNYLKRHFPQVREFIGIDIAASQIEEDRRRYPDLQFVCRDMVSWTKAHAAAYSLYHSNSGVLEYLSEQSLCELLTCIRQSSPHSLLFLIEPVHRDFDLSSEIRSRPLGSEFSYSHNYELLLQNTGFEILQLDVIPAGDYDMHLIQARTGTG